MDADLAMPLNASQDIDVARHQRTLRHDPDAQPLVLGEYLEDAARDAEAALRRLIRIRRRSNADALTLEQIQVLVGAIPQRPTEDVRCVFLHEDLPLKGEPW